jgi:hypothetical protein
MKETTVYLQFIVLLLCWHYWLNNCTEQENKVGSKYVSQEEIWWPKETDFVNRWGWSEAQWLSVYMCGALDLTSALENKKERERDNAI